MNEPKKRSKFRLGRRPLPLQSENADSTASFSADDDLKAELDALGNAVVTDQSSDSGSRSRSHTPLTQSNAAASPPPTDPVQVQPMLSDSQEIRRRIEAKWAADPSKQRQLDVLNAAREREAFYRQARRDVDPDCSKDQSHISVFTLGDMTPESCSLLDDTQFFAQGQGSSSLNTDSLRENAGDPLLSSTRAEGASARSPSVTPVPESDSAPCTSTPAPDPNHHQTHSARPSAYDNDYDMDDDDDDLPVVGQAQSLNTTQTAVRVQNHVEHTSPAPEQIEQRTESVAGVVVLNATYDVLVPASEQPSVADPNSPVTHRLSVPAPSASDVSQSPTVPAVARVSSPGQTAPDAPLTSTVAQMDTQTDRDATMADEDDDEVMDDGHVQLARDSDPFDERNVDIAKRNELERTLLGTMSTEVQPAAVAHVEIVPIVARSRVCAASRQSVLTDSDACVPDTPLAQQGEVAALAQAVQRRTPPVSTGPVTNRPAAPGTPVSMLQSYRQLTPDVRHTAHANFIEHAPTHSGTGRKCIKTRRGMVSGVLQSAFADALANVSDGNVSGTLPQTQAHSERTAAAEHTRTEVHANVVNESMALVVSDTSVTEEHMNTSDRRPQQPHTMDCPRAEENVNTETDNTATINLQQEARPSVTEGVSQSVSVEEVVFESGDSSAHSTPKRTAASTAEPGAAVTVRQSLVNYEDSPVPAEVTPEPVEVTAEPVVPGVRQSLVAYDDSPVPVSQYKSPAPVSQHKRPAPVVLVDYDESPAALTPSHVTLRHANVTLRDRRTPCASAQSVSTCSASANVSAHGQGPIVNDYASFEYEQSYMDDEDMDDDVMSEPPPEPNDLLADDDDDFDEPMEQSGRKRTHSSMSDSMVDDVHHQENEEQTMHDLDASVFGTEHSQSSRRQSAFGYQESPPCTPLVIRRRRSVRYSQLHAQIVHRRSGVACFPNRLSSCSSIGTAMASSPAPVHVVGRFVQPKARRKELVIVAPKLHDPSQADVPSDSEEPVGLRRSARVRVRPLKAELGQVPVYESEIIDGVDGIPITVRRLKGVTEPEVTDPLALRHGTLDFDLQRKQMRRTRLLRSRLHQKKREATRALRERHRQGFDLSVCERDIEMDYDEDD